MVKRLLVALAVLGLAGMLLTSRSGQAQVARIPHENPATARSSFSALSLLGASGELLGLIASRETGSATAFAEVLQRASVPEELRSIARRFEQLSGELAQRLSSIEATLDEASSLIAQGKREEAAQKLAGVGPELQRAEALVRDIREAARTMQDRLGPLAAAAPGAVSQAYDLLQQRTASLAELTQTYSRLLDSLEAATQPPEGLSQTHLTLALDATRAPVGETISVSGALASQGRSLPGRAIAILLDDQPVARAEAGPGGSYRGMVTIPSRYISPMTVKALYTPAGQDRGVYAASVSPPQQIEVVYWSTGVEVQAPGKALLGLPVRLAGEVTSQGPAALGERTVKVFLDGQQVAMGNTKGAFSLGFVPQSQLAAGSHTLAVAVDPQGPSAGARKELAVELLEPRVALEAPGFLLLPGTLRASLLVSPEVGPLSDVRANLRLGEVSRMLAPSGKGGFTAALELPLSLTLVGPQPLEASIEPVAPGGAPLRATTTVFVVNLANLGLVLALLVAAGLVVRARLPSKGGREEGIMAQSLVPEGPAQEEDLEVPEIRGQGPKDWILVAYQEAVLAVQRATGVSMRPSTTLREFLREARPSLGSALDPFSALTTLVEGALYRLPLPGPQVASEAERLSLAVRERMPRGPA